MHDENYKRLFAFRRLVEDLLRGFVAGSWTDALDFSTLEKLPSEYVSDELLARRGDAVWRVRFRGRRLYLLVLLEFQSQSEPRMALRMLTYTSLLYEELVRNGAVGKGEPLPEVLPVVLYNGESAWGAARDVGELIAPAGPELAPYRPAQRYIVVDERHGGEDDVPGGGNLMTAVVKLERCRSLAELLRVTVALQEWLTGADEGLRRAFADWVRRLTERLAPDGAELPSMRTLEEVRMTLEERVAEWPKQWFREGVEQGREQGLEQGREQGLEQGREQGLEQGREQGLAQQRALLFRLATTRFGAETAGRLAEALARVADPERLAEAGEWLVRCDTGAELLARVTALADGGNGRGGVGIG